jgi:hypothetical protein
MNTTEYRPATGERGSADYWRAVHRHEHRQNERAHPEQAIWGRAIPLGIRLPDKARGEILIFSQSTLWLNASQVPLQLEHGGTHVGHVTLHEERHGVDVDGVIYAGLAGRVNGRKELSVKIDDLELAPQRDGSLHVDECRVLEVSLCRSAMWAPHTTAYIWTPAA